MMPGVATGCAPVPDIVGDGATTATPPDIFARKNRQGRLVPRHDPADPGREIVLTTTEMPAWRVEGI
jgi:hypothetical protein